jgi:hypothetical protein
MKIPFIIFFWIINTTLLFSQITFSEIMYDVSTDESHDEFVEIFNLSTTDSVDITGWQFSDSSGVDEIIAANGKTTLAPRSFAVILDGSYFGNSTVYDSIIPPNVLILKISDNAFGSSGLSNTKGEYLSIVDSTGDTLTTYRYSVGNTPGYSDEKIVLDSSNTVSNWSDSQVEGGTPGFINSVSLRNYDIGVDETSLNYPYPIFENDSISLQVTIYNRGTQLIRDSVIVTLFSDRNSNQLLDLNDITIYSNRLYIDLPTTNSSTTILAIWKNIPAGNHSLVLHVDYSADEKNSDNIVSWNITVITRKNTLHINEIKFLTFEEEPEWIELYNSGDKPVFLKGWGIADPNDTAYVSNHIFIYPGQYKIFSEDSLVDFYDIPDSVVLILDNFPTLNNSEDDITLIEPGGGWKERIIYSVDWLEGFEAQNVSLERINPGLYENKSENWGPSVASIGATPGEQNSIYSDLSIKNAKVEISPNPFSPDNDGFEDYAIISGEIPEKSARIKIQIFDIKGRKIKTLQDNNFTGSTFNVVWDGKDEHNQYARMGIYIVFVQILNDRNGNIKEMKSSVVLAHKL